jgi:hypothetical protein
MMFPNDSEYERWLLLVFLFIKKVVEWCSSDAKDLKKVVIIAGLHLGEAVLAELEVAQQATFKEVTEKHSACVIMGYDNS